jgi:hypothetical protein
MTIIYEYGTRHAKKWMKRSGRGEELAFYC